MLGKVIHIYVRLIVWPCAPPIVHESLDNLEPCISSIALLGIERDVNPWVIFQYYCNGQPIKTHMFHFLHVSSWRLTWSNSRFLNLFFLCEFFTTALNHACSKKDAIFIVAKKSQRITLFVVPLSTNLNILSLIALFNTHKFYLLWYQFLIQLLLKWQTYYHKFMTLIDKWCNKRIPC